MQYVDGGSLAQEIDRKSKSSTVKPYAEQRIAFYALQVREDNFHCLHPYVRFAAFSVI